MALAAAEGSAVCVDGSDSACGHEVHSVSVDGASMTVVDGGRNAIGVGIFLSHTTFSVAFRKERPTSILPPLPSYQPHPTALLAHARRFLFGVGRNHFCSWQRLWYCGRVNCSDASSSLPFVCPRKGRSQSRSYCTTANSMRPITLQSIIR